MTRPTMMENNQRIDQPMPPTPLQQLIIERILREGPITFAEYMRMALYEPGLGYYVAGPSRVGWEGDFFTSTDVSPLFANCMGRQLYHMWEQLGQPAVFTVMEQGAGRGKLAEGVRAWARGRSDSPDFAGVATPEKAAFAAALDYRVEDIRTGQNAIVGERAWGQEEVSSNIFSIRPQVFLSNELVDAFPVHIVEKRNGRLYEVYVHVQKGRLSEVLGEVSSSQVANYLETYNIPWLGFPEGWRAEINLDALRWMRQTAQLLARGPAGRKARGFILTIDYGDKARSLYTRSRPRGTLACYFQHQLTERPLSRPGEQDITAHVNFSALIQEGRHQGLRLHSFSSQQQWLEGLGIREELEYIRQRDFAAADTERGTDRGQTALLQWRSLQQSVSILTDPAGMGNFKVLILKR